MTKQKARKISHTVYIIAATALLTAVGTGLFFERYKLQTPILIQLRTPVVERELISPVVDQVEAKEVSNDDTGGTKEALRGEDKSSTQEINMAGSGVQWGDYTTEEKIELAMGEDAELWQHIAFCESSMNPKAENKNSSAKGLFQIMSSVHEIAPKWLLDEDINIMIMKKMAEDQGTTPWNASKHCWGV